MAEIYEWADSAGGNGLDNPPDWPKENMDKSDVNDCLREMMAAMRVWYQAPQWLQLFDSTDETWTVSRLSDTEVRVAGPSDASAAFPYDRRVKITASSGPTTVYGYVHPTTGPSYGSPNTDVTVVIDAAGTVPVGTDTIEVCIVELKTAAYRNVGSGAAEVPDGDALAASIAANISADSAAFTDVADAFGDPGEIPIYDQLGTVGQYDQGTGAGEIPFVGDLPGILSEQAYEDIPDFVFGEKTSNQTVSSAEVDITSMTGIELPGTPDGVKKYVLDAMVQYGSACSNAHVRVYIGSSGDLGDTEMLDFPHIESGEGWLSVAGYEFTPGVADTHIGFSFDHSNVSSQTVYGSSNVRSWLRVREVIE